MAHGTLTHTERIAQLLEGCEAVGQHWECADAIRHLQRALAEASVPRHWTACPGDATPDACPQPEGTKCHKCWSEHYLEQTAEEAPE